jgi:hypothetical protein
VVLVAVLLLDVLDVLDVDVLVLVLDLTYQRPMSAGIIR